MRRLLTIDQAWREYLEIDDVIHGLNQTEDYNNVEVIAAERFEADLRDTMFFSCPLGVAIRPPRFLGELRNGIAIVSPTNLALLNDWRSTAGNLPLAQSDVLTFIVQADLYTAAHGVVDQITQVVTYFCRTHSGKYDRHRQIFGKISRKLWPVARSEIADQLNYESSERAAKAREFALRHLYGGGAPQ